MKTWILILLVPALLSAKDYIFVGPWVTTNRPLDGVMTAIITPTGKDQWKGRFYGVWQGVSYDYPAVFSGPPGALHGTATIDGAPYEWRGRIDRQKLVGNFSGMYQGSFEMKRIHFHQGRWWHQDNRKQWSYWNEQQWVLYKKPPSDQAASK